MRSRSLVFALLVLAAAPPAAQSKKPTAVPRAADGRPDLQGTWDFAQLTPFERPSEFAGKDSVTDEEAEEFAQKRIETTHKDRRDGGAAADVERAYNDFWWDFGKRIAKQPSLVVDPPDGRVPTVTADAQQRIADRRNHYDNPEERPLPPRSLLGCTSSSASRASTRTRCATTSRLRIRRRGPDRGVRRSRCCGPRSACSSTRATSRTTRSKVCCAARGIRRSSVN